MRRPLRSIPAPQRAPRSPLKPPQWLSCQTEKPQPGCATRGAEVSLLPQQLCLLIPVTTIRSRALPPALPAACLPCRSSIGLCSSSSGLKHRHMPPTREAPRGSRGDSDGAGTGPGTAEERPVRSASPLQRAGRGWLS